MKTVGVAFWTEYERGWGQRSDGISVHLSYEEAVEYERDYITKYHPVGYVPDCYSQVSNFFIGTVQDDFYQLLSVKQPPVIWFDNETELTKEVTIRSK